MIPSQDIDGVVPGSGFMPPSVRGLDLLIQEWGYDPAGKTGVVIGRGDVGRPMAEYLLGRDATVTVCHSRTPIETMIKAMRESDILVGAAGLEVPIMSLVKSADSVVIDYGITKGEDGKLHGDFQSGLAQYYKYHTAVPGGMGLMVRAGLLEANLQKVGQGEVQSVHLMELYGASTGREVRSPISTVTASGAHHAVIVTTLQQVDAAARLGHWPEIRELLNQHCGYSIGADEILLIKIADEWYFISDIGLRMLTPRELYSANGFPPDYIIDRDYMGNRCVKSDQVARCGNAVPPPFAAALVRANLPEWCSQPALQTMQQVQDAVAF